MLPGIIRSTPQEWHENKNSQGFPYEFPLSKFGYCALLENFRRSSKTVQDDYLDVKNEVVWCDCKFWKAQDQSGRKFSFDLSKDLSDKSEKINNIISDKIRRKKAQQPESDGGESFINCPSFSFYNFHWCVGLHQQQVPTTHIKLWKWPNRSKHWINSEYESYAKIFATLLPFCVIFEVLSNFSLSLPSRLSIFLERLVQDNF